MSTNLLFSKVDTETKKVIVDIGQPSPPMQLQTYYMYRCDSIPQLYFYIKAVSSGLPIPKTPPPASKLSIYELWNGYDGVIIFTLTDSSTLTGTNLKGYCSRLMTTADMLISKAQKKTGFIYENPYKAILWTEDVLSKNILSINDTSFLFSFRVNNNFYAIGLDLEVGFGNLNLPISNEFSLVSAKDNSTYSPTEAVINGFVLSPWDEDPIGTNASIKNTPQWFISLNKADYGTLQGTLALKCINSSGLNDWAPGIRNSIQVTAADNKISNVSQYYPIFQSGGEKEFILYDVKWKAFDPKRTTIQFNDRAFQLGTSEVTSLTEIQWPKIKHQELSPLFAFDYVKMAFISAFNTVEGSKKVLLYPQSNAGLVVSDYINEEGNKKYYLMPSGDFEFGVHIPEGAQYSAGDQIKLICGIAGSEFIKITPRFEDTFGDIITFNPQTHNNPNAHSVLYSSCLISIKVREGNTSPYYYAQPAAASLFNYANSVGTNPILIAEDVKNKDLSTAVIEFPMLPYGNLKPNNSLTTHDLSLYELTEVAKKRKKAISENNSGTQIKKGKGIVVDNVTSSKTCATPQGFLASIANDGLDWSNVKLALANPPLTTNYIQFNKTVTGYIPDQLRDTLQSNQLFMVVSNQGSNLLGDFSSTFTLDGWPFDANIPKIAPINGDYNNVMIMKFSHGTLKDLVLNYKNWSNGEYYNSSNAEDVSTWIYDYISEAELAVEKSKNSANSGQTNWLKNFVDIANNPAWNGILFLKVDVSVQDFPKELKGILAGINLNEFYGHHIGINVNHLEYLRGELEITDSSLFGLINYVAKGTSGSNAGVGNSVYNFEVLNLQVLFENSKIQNYSSHLQLTTSEWFSEKATLNKNSGIQGFTVNAIELYGHLAHHNGVNVYTFTTKPNEIYQFMLDSHIMNYVDITGASFTTTHVSSASKLGNSSKEAIQTRFQFTGSVNFICHKSFDVLSYGSTNTSKIDGLTFHNLFVDMNFNLTTNTISDDSNTDHVKIYFDPSVITFDLKSSYIRTQSMYNKFPLTLSKLTAVNINDRFIGGTPANSGYLPISLNTTTKFTKLDTIWYGLEYNFNLGTPGALAAKMDFTASLIVAWSPGGTKPQLEVGIKLPGSGGGKKLLSLENVLKLSIKQILFEATKDSLEQDELAYTLKFFNIALKFFSISLPIHGALNAELFGNPNGAHKGSSDLGWYAEYDNLPTNNLND